MRDDGRYGATAEALVFVSYSHEDRAFVPKLDQYLKPLLPGGVTLWWDHDIRVGDRFDDLIRERIVRSLAAVVLVSPALAASDYVTNVELPALIECGIPLAPIHYRPTSFEAVPGLRDVQWVQPDVGRDEPIMLTGGEESTEAQIDQKMVRLSERIAARIRDEYETWRATLGPDGDRVGARAATPKAELVAGSAGRLLGVPALGDDIVDRPDELKTLRDQLLSLEPALGLTGTSTMGLQGQGGIGKTVLAVALARDPQVLAAFPDGIFWVALGEKPDIALKQQELLFLVDAAATAENPWEIRQRLVEVLADKQALLVVDDIWTSRAGREFQLTGPRGRVLYTTRDERVLDDLWAAVSRVDVLSGDAAWAILQRASRWAHPDRPTAWERVAAATGGVALALALAGAALRGSPAEEWVDLVAELESDDSWLDHPYADVFRVMNLATSQLPDGLRQRLFSLAVYPEDTPIPLDSITTFWGHMFHDQSEGVLALVDRLAAAEVIERSPGHVRLHDLRREFLRLRADDIVVLHSRLIDSYRARGGSWVEIAEGDPYLPDHLIPHLVAAFDQRQAEEVLRDAAWIGCRLVSRGPIALDGDLRHLAPTDTSRHLAEILEAEVGCWAHLVTSSPDQRLPAFSREQRSTVLAQIAPAAPLDADALRRSVRPGIQPLWHLRTAHPAQRLVLAGHTDGVWAMAWSPDGTRLASASFDATVRVWDPTAGIQTQQLEGHTSGVLGVAWSPDGTRLASASHDGTVRVWDPTTGTQTQVLQGQTRGAVRGVEWSPDGTRLASASDDATVRVWDPTAGTQTQVLLGHATAVLGVGWSPDGTRLASASRGGTVRVWNPTTGTQTQVLEGHTDWVRAVAWSPDGTRLASASRDRTVRIWDPTTGIQTQQLEGHTSGVRAVAWSPDGTRLASASFDATVRVWDPTTGIQTQQLEGHTNAVLGVAWSPDGTRLASASMDGTVRVWDPTTGTHTQQLEGHTSGVLGVGWSPDGTRLASASRDATVRIWDRTTGTHTQVLEGHTTAVLGVGWSPDGTRLASASDDATVRIWDPTAGIQTQRLEGHTSGVRAVAWSPDGTRLASASRDRTVRIWNPTTETQVLRGHTNAVEAVAWSPDGTRLASASRDRTVRIWDPTTGIQTQPLEGHTSRVLGVAWSPDGTRLVSASRNGTVRTWPALVARGWLRRRGLLQRFMRALHQLVEAGGVQDVCWSPDGNRLGTVSGDGHVRLWDVESLECLMSARVARSARAIDWSEAGLAVGFENTVMVYEVLE